MTDRAAERPRCRLLVVTAALAFGAGLARAAAPPRPDTRSARQLRLPPGGLLLEPTGIRLGHPGATQRLVATALRSDGTARDVSTECAYESLAPRVAAVSADGVVRGLAPGQATIRARLGRATGRIAIAVADKPSNLDVNFTADLISIFTQKSCNNSGCHGSPAGQNGFKLSLFGYDPKADYEMIVKARDGRRVNLKAPEQSLILLKPSASVPHGGGLRLPKESPEYQTILGWLRQGAAFDSSGPRVTAIEIFPADRILVGVGAKQRFVVAGRLSDGTTRDMTREVRYQVKDDGVATLDADGVGHAVAPGQTHVMIRAMGRVSAARIGVLAEPPLRDYPAAAPENFVDEAVFARLRRLNLIPSELSSDEEFLRRVYLDVVGLLPAPEERERFLGDPRRDRRRRLIDELLARPEFAAFWTTKFEDTFRNHQTPIQGRAQGEFRRYLRNFIHTDRPYDEVAREMLTSLGDQTLNPAACFWAPMTDLVADDLKVNLATTTVSRVFLGSRTECVECHNHPLENLTQNDFFDLSAFFGQLRVKHGYEAYRKVWYLDPERQVLHPQTKQPLRPAIPFERDFPVGPSGDRRIDLARWITRPDNPFFARAIVNRIWREYFNAGIVEPFDDFRTTNPPSNQELLDALAQHLVANGFRLKAVHRAILTSRTYQLSSRPNPRNQLRGPQLFTHYNVRILAAEPLLDALSEVSGVAHRFEFYPKGTRAQDVIYPDYPGYFLDIFGFLQRLSLEERRKEPSLSQALHMMFGDTILGKVRSEDNRIRRLIQAGKSDDEIVGELFVRAYSRNPGAEEADLARRYVAGGLEAGIDRAKALDDVLWAVCNSKEFMVNH
jgi:hypothetical protein